MKRNLYIGSTLLALLVVLGFGQGLIVKKADIRANPSLSAALDQSFHLLALFITAIIVGH